jgi:hypothetical protein
MEKDKIIWEFIKNFVLKDRRERSQLELTSPKRRGDFADKLNHTWDKIIDMKKLKHLPKVPNDYQFVKSELKLNDTDLCYVISNYRDIDDELIQFK